MSEDRSYHHLPSTTTAPQICHLGTAATPYNPFSFTLHPPSVSWFTEQGMAACKNTNDVPLHNVEVLQVHNPQHTFVIDEWLDTRNHMSPSSSSGHLSNMPPNYSIPRTIDLGLTKLEKESNQITVDLSVSTQNNDISYLKQLTNKVNNKISSKIATVDDTVISAITLDSQKLFMLEAKGSNLPVFPEGISIHNVKCSYDGYEKINEQGTKSTEDADGRKNFAVTPNVEQMFKINQSENLSDIKTIYSTKLTSPSMIKENSVEKIVGSQSHMSKMEHGESKNSLSSDYSQKTIFTNSQFLEVKHKSEELLNKIVTLNGTTSFDRPEVIENKSKSKISTTKPSTKRRKKIKKNKNIPLKPKILKPVKPATKQFNGPFIRINDGDIKNPTSFDIINRDVQDEEGSLDSRNTNRKSYFKKYEENNGEEIPDMSNVEKSEWQCVYCSKGSNVMDIDHVPTGDLFGPYYIPKDANRNDISEQETSNHILPDNNTPEKFIEVWTHEYCLVWASGVYMVGTKVVGLEDSIRTAKNTICVYCGGNGASIGCTTRHCKSTTHYSCAVNIGWLLNSQTFMTTCNVHRNFIPGNSCR